MRRGNDPLVGGLTARDVILFNIAFIAPIMVGIIWGIAEPAFFTSIARTYNEALNYAVIFNHWSWLCVLMGLSFLVAGVVAALINFVQYGWTPRTQIILVGGLLGAVTAIFVEDLVAHLRYGALPQDDWTHWILPAVFLVKTNFWLPLWYFIVIMIVAGVFVWFAFYYIVNVRGGRCR